jgi:hypothetical protein
MNGMGRTNGHGYDHEDDRPLDEEFVSISSRHPSTPGTPAVTNRLEATTLDEEDLAPAAPLVIIELPARDGHRFADLFGKHGLKGQEKVKIDDAVKRVFDFVRCVSSTLFWMPNLTVTAPTEVRRARSHFR